MIHIDPIIDNILTWRIYTAPEGRQGRVIGGDKYIDHCDPNTEDFISTQSCQILTTRPASMGKRWWTVNSQHGGSGAAVLRFLSVIRQFERPELEKQRATFSQQRETSAEVTEMLKDLEDSLLRELSQSTGNMLDNTDLISTLDSTKVKASEVADKLKLGARTAKEIEYSREVYTSPAKLGAIIFFVLTDHRRP